MKTKLYLNRKMGKKRNIEFPKNKQKIDIREVKKIHTSR